MGNNSTKQTSNNRPKKNVHWKSAEIPSPPGKPYLVSNIDAPPDVVTLRWEKPRTDGGSPIYGYLVEHRRTGSPHWVRASPSLIPFTELSLSGLEPGWRYQFRVTAENAVGASDSSELSDAVTVTLQRDAVTPPRFVNEIHDTVAVENEKVEFRVQVQGTPPPIINWYKDGFEVFSSRRTKIVNENNTSILIIHQAALTDEGEIKCSATNRAGHVITRAQLKLEAIPKIRLPRQYEEGLLIEADEVVRLKVGIAGRPSPMVVWCHNGEIIKTGGRYEIVSNDKHSSLKITSAKRSDRGEYNLRAINKLGDDNVSFLVTVTDKPSPPGKVTLSMSIGKSASLQWTAPDDDGGCKIGNYVVEYFRVGWNMWLKAATTRQLNATLNDLIEGSEYKFRVKAESPYGMSEPSEESDVLFIPDPKRGINKPIESAKDASISEAPPTPRKRNPSPSVGDRKPIKVDKQEQTTRKVISFDVPPLPSKVQINTQIYDSGAIVREMNYGTSVDEKKNELADEMNRRDESIMKEMTFSGLNETYNPRGKLKEPVENIDKQPPTRSILKKSEYENFRDGKSNGKTLNMHLSAPQDNPDEVHTSSEFVLVLYDDDKRNNQEKPLSFDLELDEAILPPPLSLSAPELGTLRTEPQTPPLLRRCVSSTELLYEKAMARFYQAVELEESESARKRSASIEPASLRPRLSSIGDSERNSIDRHPLERENSFNRKSTEKVGLATLAKVESLAALNDIKPFNIESDDKDTEETEDERDLKTEILDSQRKISFVQNRTASSSVEYEDDYTDSTASSASLSSIDSLEKFKSTLLAMNKLTPNVKQSADNELNTYHPMMEPQSESSRKIIENPLQTVYDLHLRREEFSNDADVSQSIDDEEMSDSREIFVKSDTKPKPEPRALSPYRIPEPDQSTIVLTKPLPAPSADFVPKPILKTSTTESDLKEKPIPKAREKKKERKGIMQFFSGKKATSDGSLSSPQDKLKTEIVEPKTEKMTPAAVAKKKSMEQRQSSIEENQVAVDHYSDIVKEMSVLKKPKVPLYMSCDELKKAAEKAEDEIDSVQKAASTDVVTKLNLETDTKDSYEKPSVARRSLSRESESRSIFAIKLSKEPKRSIQREEFIRSQLSMENDSPITSIPPENLSPKVTELDLKPQDSKPTSSQEAASNESVEPTRGRSSKANKIPTKTTPRSRSSSTLRNKSVQLKEPDNKLLLPTRTPSKTRNRSESKSPSVKNRTKIHPTNTLRVARALHKDVDSKSSTPSASPEPRSQTPEELMVEAEEKVKSTMNYVTDLALFIVACWVYVFKDAWMAVPILSLMVGRQVGSTLKDKFPKWMKRKRD